MGPCVRLIRALVAQPQPQPELTEEESQKQWAEFKNIFKSEGVVLREAKILPGLRQSGETTDFCITQANCTNIVVSPLSNPTIDDDKTLAGKAMLTYSDGTTEPAEIHHVHGYLAGFRVETRMLTPTKDIHFNTYCNNKAFKFLCSTQGTSITTAPDRTKNLGVVFMP